ncbi:MAG: hypothetical protein JSS49_08430 [Planctomycetes bacterium]|nr:hypothetical protein [Planctomycetota bacterium]
MALAGLYLLPCAAFAGAPGEPPKLTRISATEPAASAVDPLEHSRKVRANLEMWPERVRRRLTEAEQRLKGLDLKEIKTQKMFAQDFDEILQDLDEEALAIQDAFGKITTDLLLYREAVAQAPASFRGVAAAFEKKATESDDLSLKGHYADFAATSHKLAERYEAKYKTLITLEKELATKLQFVAKSRIFIADVKDFISTIPATEEGLEVEAFVKRLNAYVTVFQDSIKMLKGLSDQIGQEPTSPGATQKLDRGIAPGRETTSRPVTVDEYRHGLAQLRRVK